MVLLTYQLPDAIREIALQGEFNEFDLNELFHFFFVSYRPISSPSCLSMPV
jgi:hypothetical protein